MDIHKKTIYLTIYLSIAGNANQMQSCKNKCRKSRWESGVKRNEKRLAVGKACQATKLPLCWVPLTQPDRLSFLLLGFSAFLPSCLSISQGDSFSSTIFATGGGGQLHFHFFSCFMLLTLLCLPTPQPQFISFQLPCYKKKRITYVCVCVSVCLCAALPVPAVPGLSFVLAAPFCLRLPLHYACCSQI